MIQTKTDDEMKEILNTLSFYKLNKMLGDMTFDAGCQARYQRGMSEIRQCVDDYILKGRGIWMCDALCVYDARLNGRDTHSIDVLEEITRNSFVSAIVTLVKLCAEKDVKLKQGDAYKLYDYSIFE